MHATGGFRYVRVSIDISLKPDRRIILLGHELWHALEVAANVQTRDRESFLQ